MRGRVGSSGRCGLRAASVAGLISSGCHGPRRSATAWTWPGPRSTSDGWNRRGAVRPAATTASSVRRRSGDGEAAQGPEDRETDPRKREDPGGSNVGRRAPPGSIAPCVSLRRSALGQSRSPVPPALRSAAPDRPKGVLAAFRRRRSPAGPVGGAVPLRPWDPCVYLCRAFPHGLSRPDTTNGPRRRGPFSRTGGAITTFADIVNPRYPPSCHTGLTS